MSVITLRGLNSEAEKKVRKLAAGKKESMNHFLVDMIEKNVFGKKSGKPHQYNDLDDLIGSLNDEDIKNLDQSLSEQRKIDSELWS